MAYVYGNPRYGVTTSFRNAGEDSGGSKTINYLNLSIGGASASGYTPEQVYSFVHMIGSVTNKEVGEISVTAQRPLVEEESGDGGEEGG